MSFEKFLEKLSHQAASELTKELRERALNGGWDKEVVDNLHVEYTDKTMRVQVHPDYAERAFKHEFGDGNSRPSAIVRKLGSDREVSKKVIGQALRGGAK
jgi:hypothetical protein